MRLYNLRISKIGLFADLILGTILLTMLDRFKDRKVVNTFSHNLSFYYTDKFYE
jgi:hypothetical protein